MDWPCEVKTLFREENLGCKYAVSRAITWFFGYEEQGIILEDDCLPSQSFFWFCEEMLERFRSDERVMSISGTNITKNVTFEADYYLSEYALMWGWASWRRAWEKYDPELLCWHHRKNSGWLKSLKMGSVLFERVWVRIFDQTAEKGHSCSWWGYQWIYCCWAHRGWTVAPSKNLIRNLGFGQNATHTHGSDPYRDNLALCEFNFPLSHPRTELFKTEADQFVSRHWFHIAWTAEFKWLLLNVPGAKKVNSVRKVCARFFLGKWVSRQ